MRTKEKLIERIQHIQDESILAEIMEMVELELNRVGEVIQLTDQQKHLLMRELKTKNQEI